MFAVVSLPGFPLQAVLRAEPELMTRPVALVDPEAARPLILQLNRAALKQGVQTGLTASQAMARCSTLLIKTRSSAQETAASEVLLQTAYAFSARIEATAPGVCTLSLQGLTLDDGQLALWAERIRQTLATLGLVAHIGVAITPGLALLAARNTRTVLVVKDATAFVADMPLRALEPEPKIAEILARWGIRTAGAFIALGKDKVLERLGTEALDLFERVSPAATRPLRLVSPPDTFAEQMECEVPIEMVEPLLFVLRRFVEQLCRRVELVYLVVAELHLRLDLASGANHSHTFPVPSPTAHVDTLFRMLQTHLDGLRTDAPIVRLQLSASPGKRDVHQFGLFETTLRNPNQFAETLARLTALCGVERVGTPVLEATHRPDAFTVKTPDFGQKKGSSPCRVQGLQLRRYRPAVAAVIQFQGPRPAVIRCDHVRGPIMDVRGPFLSSGDWWEDRRWAREEWDVAVNGGLYRVYRAQGNCFVEGVYD